MPTTITGASDDLIELDGQIREELNTQSDTLLAFSDGTLLEVAYDADGIWRIKRLSEGACGYQHISGDVETDTNDIVILTGDLKWCVHGERGDYNPVRARKAEAA